ncbi:low molecular weight phosphatase family protein [Arthrobacter nitrophenolicus]|uniref:Low molecular weight phosphatase family protein n=1 Tax=Arthrobacter nitrophenolicus TaxID=683150 RepID=A0A4R5Y1I1_9MICC|nr:low molecular weight phosphatase family protein [Arthrobacter nitrophenolicus]TDL37307.1 low molecular weight phosphatase family protein [Arthrobacter nitrophenolicus]
MDTSAPVRILTVCTGNICRSPVAERLLQAGLDQVLPGGFEVASAGTRAMVGDPIQPLSADIVRTFGGDPEGFAARQLTPKILRGVDLVLTMTSGHRGEVLQLDASLLKRTFTIREFARMLDVLDERDASSQPPAAAASDMPDGGDPLAANTAFWRGLPARAAGVRHLSLPADAAENDVIDPYRRAPEVYRQMEDELAPAIVSILRHARLHAPDRRKTANTL